jgi:hypothetical protein
VLAAAELVRTRRPRAARAAGAPYDDPLELGAAPDPLEVAAGWTGWRGC